MPSNDDSNPAPVHRLVGRIVYIIQGLQKNEKISEATLVDYFPKRDIYKYLIRIHKLNNGLYSWAKVYESRRSCAAAVAANERWSRYCFRLSSHPPNRELDGAPENQK